LRSRNRAQADLDRKNPESKKSGIEKIRILPPDRLVEVEDFVDFIQLREQQRALTRAAAAASLPSFAALWKHPENDVYDTL
jgi:hypothetical protein